MHTWDARAVPGECQDYSKWYNFESDQLKNWNDDNWWQYGTNQMLPYEAKAGEVIEFTVHFDWNREMSADWSVTAWGEHGSVSVAHENAEYKTDHMPVAPPLPNEEEIFKKWKSEKKFDRKVKNFKTTNRINGDKNCKYSVSHTYEGDRWNFMAKLDCPSKPDLKMNLSLLMSESQWHHPLYKWFDQD